MDPPEFRTSRSRANPLGLRPESDVGTRSVKIWAGPSRRPSGINALTFGRAKITLKLSPETPSNRGQELDENQALAGRLARETFRIKANAGDFPQRTARRGSWEQATERDLEQRTKSSFSRARAGIRLRCLYRRPGGRRQSQRVRRQCSSEIPVS